MSFLISRKRTVKFRNQRLGRHQAADYTIIMSRILKVTGNHVMYDRGAWFLSQVRALCACRQWRNKNIDFQVCFVARHQKKLKTRTQKTQKGRRRWQRSCLLITWKRKNWENLRYFYRFRNKLSVTLTVVTIFFFFRECIIKQLLDQAFVISRIIRASVRVITPTSTLIILDITKNSSNSCLLLLLLLLLLSLLLFLLIIIIMLLSLLLLSLLLLLKITWIMPIQ